MSGLGSFRNNITQMLRMLFFASKADMKIVTFTIHFASLHCIIIVTYVSQREKSCLRGFANNKAADQPAHMFILISIFVIRFLESMLHVNLLKGKFQYST